MLIWQNYNNEKYFTWQYHDNENTRSIRLGIPSIVFLFCYIFNKFCVNRKLYLLFQLINYNLIEIPFFIVLIIRKLFVYGNFMKFQPLVVMPTNNTNYDI